MFFQFCNQFYFLIFSYVKVSHFNVLMFSDKRAILTRSLFYIFYFRYMILCQFYPLTGTDN